MDDTFLSKGVSLKLAHIFCLGERLKKDVKGCSIIHVLNPIERR